MDHEAHTNAWGDELPPQPLDSPEPTSYSTTVQSPPKSGRTRPGRRGFTRVDLKPVQSLGPLDCDAGPAAGAIPPSLSTNLPSSSLSPAGSGGPASSSMSARFGHLSLDDHADRPDSAGPNTADPSADSGRRSSHALSTAPDSAKASFRITVGDPHKVGDLATSHTEYQIRTVTTSKAFRCSEFEVPRRFSDFLWLYDQLHAENPGVIIPPPPEKKVMNRFNSDFVETRRQSLNRMLSKIAAHPILQNDNSFRFFLESESFSANIKNMERKHPAIKEPKGVFASIVSTVKSTPSYIEENETLVKFKAYCDTLEAQLKALGKAVDAVVERRKDLASSCESFAESLEALADAELSSSLSVPLDHLAYLQSQMRDLYGRQAEQDELTIGIVIDEYIRIIGSVKDVYRQRRKAFESWHAAESKLKRAQADLSKLSSTSTNLVDKLKQQEDDVDDATRVVTQAKLLFEKIGKQMQTEFDRFEIEKVEDFKAAVETYLESAIETQKQLIEQWKTFRLLLDNNDDDEPDRDANGADGAGASTPRPVAAAGEGEGDDDGKANTDAGSVTPSSPSMESSSHRFHAGPELTTAAEFLTRDASSARSPGAGWGDAW